MLSNEQGQRVRVSYSERTNFASGLHSATFQRLVVLLGNSSVNTLAAIEELLEAVFCVPSVSRLYTGGRKDCDICKTIKRTCENNLQ
jgi:hypothetical protein